MSFECVLLPDTEPTTTADTSETSTVDKIPANYTGGILNKIDQKDERQTKYRNSCCVLGCASKSTIKDISFFRLPKDKKQNKLWKIKLRLADNLYAASAVCSKHFLDSDYVANHSNHVRRPLLLKNAVPSQNLPVASFARRKDPIQIEKRAERLLNRNAKQATKETPNANGIIGANELVKKKRYRKAISTHVKAVPANSAKKISNASTVSLDKKPDSLNESTTGNGTPHRLDVMDFLNTRTKLHAWTGIQTFSLLRKIEERVSLFHPKVIVNGNDFSLLDGILLCFIKLRTKLSFVCLTSIFHISSTIAAKVFQAMLLLIKKALDDGSYFSSTIVSKDNQPIQLLMYGYIEARAIVDCADEDVTHSKYSCNNQFDPLTESDKQNPLHVESKPSLTDLHSAMLDYKADLQPKMMNRVTP